MKRPAMNPYLPSWEYVPDGEPHVFGDRLYIFGSHDRFSGDAYCENDYVCWSAPVDNLGDWKFEGTIYTRKQDPHGKGKLSLFAPDVCQGVDGRFYLYYSAADTSIISVAVAEKPEGPYQYYGDVVRADGHIQGSAATDPFQFDPAVLVDGDRVYLYSGFRPLFGKQVFGHPAVGPMMMELDRDMKTILRGPMEIMKLPKGMKKRFYEASSIRRFGDQFYFIYSSAMCHILCYATADRPEGPFVYQGILYSNGNGYLSNGNIGTYPIGNNHGSIVKLNDRYYVFGHRHTNGNGHTRQGIADEIFMDAHGRFQQAEYTSQGLHAEPLPARGYYPSYIACYLMGKWNGRNRPFITQSGDDRFGGEDQYVTAIRNGSCVGYKYFKTESVKRLSVFIRGNAYGTLSVGTAPGKQNVCSISVDVSDEEKWNAHITEVSLPAHEKVSLYFSFSGTGTCDLRGFEFHM